MNFTSKLEPFTKFDMARVTEPDKNQILDSIFFKDRMGRLLVFSFKCGKKIPKEQKLSQNSIDDWAVTTFEEHTIVLIKETHGLQIKVYTI